MGFWWSNPNYDKDMCGNIANEQSYQPTTYQYTMRLCK